MTKLKMFLCLFFLLNTYFVTACNDEIEIENVSKGSFEYWCLVSGGEWRKNKCICGSQMCKEGAFCQRDTFSTSALQCTAKPTEIPSDIEDKTTSENEQKSENE